MPSEDYDLSSQTHRELMFNAAYVPHEILRDDVDDDAFENMTTPCVTVSSPHTQNVYVVITNDPDMTDHCVLRQRVHRTSPDDADVPKWIFQYDVVAEFSSELNENLTSAVLCIAQAMMRDDAVEAERDARHNYRQGFLNATHRVREHPELPDHDPDPALDL